MARRHARWVLVLAALVTPRSASAQIGIELQGGPSIPVDLYAAESGSRSGAAAVGFTALGNVYAPIPSVRGLGLLFTGGITAHRVQDIVRETVLLLGATDVSVGTYRAVPLLAGLRYRLPLFATVSLRLEAQLGVVVFTGPTLTVDGVQSTYETESFRAYAAGVGLDLTSRLGIGARAVNLGDITTHQGIPSVGSVEVEQVVGYVDVLLSVRVR